jgi:formimidoylglutamate deiminase
VNCPIHIHIAEQEKEVADCLAWSGQRPVAWLLDHAPVDAHWCLVHATHMTPEEIKRLAGCGAVAGLCPTTEANLGDGIFPAEAYLKEGGALGVGSDSHVCVSPWEELRLLEYGQRLATRKRARLCSEIMPSVGRTLFTQAIASGAQALGLGSGAIAPGQRADLVALSTDDPLLAGKEGDRLLDTLIFAVTPRITDLWVAGKNVIKGGHHPLEEESARALREVMRSPRLPSSLIHERP